MSNPTQTEMSDLASTLEKDGGLLAIIRNAVIETAKRPIGRRGPFVFEEGQLQELAARLAALASPAPAESGEPVAEIEGLIDAYWGLAFNEGRENRSTDTPAGDAQRVRSAITSRLKLLAHPPAESAGSPSTSGVGVPDGWVLVPREPTLEMQDAGEGHGYGVTRIGARAIYRAMLSAAPTQDGGNG